VNNAIKKGAMISYFSILFNIGVGFIYTPWIINSLGSSDYGIYTLAISVISFFLLDFGLSNAVTRFISMYRAQNKEDEIKNLLGMIFKLYFMINILIFIVLVVIYYFISDIYVQLSASEITRLKNVFLIVGTYSLIAFPMMPLDGILSGYEKFFQLKLFPLFQRILTIILTIICLYLNKGLYAVVFVNAFSSILIVGIKYIYVKKFMKISINLKAKDKLLFFTIFKFSIWITIISISQRLIINISPTILGAMSGTEQITIFSIGASLEGYIWIFANALNGLFLPKVSRIVFNNINEKEDEILKLMIKVGKIQLILMGMIILGFISFGKQFVYLWVGEKFQDAYWVSLLMILPGLITHTQEIGTNYLMAINEVKYRSFSFIVAAIFGLTTSLLFSSRLGAIGPALGVFIGTLIGHIFMMNYFYSKKLNLNIKKFFNKVFFKVVPVQSICLIMGILLNQIEFLSNAWMDLGIKIIIFMIVYGFLIFILGLDNNEKKKIIDILKGRFKIV